MKLEEKLNELIDLDKKILFNRVVSDILIDAVKNENFEMEDVVNYLQKEVENISKSKILKDITKVRTVKESILKDSIKINSIYKDIDVNTIYKETKLPIDDIRWSIGKMSAYIESILINVPNKMLHFDITDTKYLASCDVDDMNDKIYAIHQFIDGEFALTGELVPELKGIKFEEISDMLLNKEVKCNVIYSDNLEATWEIL